MPRLRAVSSAFSEEQHKPQPTKTIWAIGSMGWLAEQTFHRRIALARQLVTAGPFSRGQPFTL